MLKEYNQYSIEDEKLLIWQEFTLEDKTILAINKSTNKCFLINPSQKPNQLFTKKVKLEENFNIEAYQVFNFYPGMLKFVFDGNFNTIDNVELELEKETMEGTATYLGIKSSEYVGYDFGVMYFDNNCIAFNS